MNEAQKQQLVIALRASADATIVSLLAARADEMLMNYINDKATPAVKAWKTNVPTNDSDDAPDYSTYDALQAGKRDSWNLFLRAPRDFTRNKVRKWITDVWGNATAASNAEAILNAGVENARRVEVLIGGSNASTGTVTAMKRDFEGPIGLQELSIALSTY